MTIEGLFDRVRSMDLRSEVPVLINQTKAEMILLNQLQLFSHGIDANGKLLKEYSNPYYAKKKNARNPGPGLGHPDFKDTGEFYQDFMVETSSHYFEVDSKNVKTAALIKRDGEAIFGLTKDNRKVYALGVFYSVLQRYVTLKTGLVFS